MRLAFIPVALILLISSLAVRPAIAATSSASFAVSVVVQSSCQASAPSSAFGNHPTAGSSPVSVTCTLPTAYDVSLSADLTGSSGGLATGSAKTLRGYALSPGSTRLHEQGGIGGKGNLAGAGVNNSKAQNSYQQGSWMQEVASGAFADAVTVTIAY